MLVVGLSYIYEKTRPKSAHMALRGLESVGTKMGAMEAGTLLAMMLLVAATRWPVAASGARRCRWGERGRGHGQRS